MSGETERDVSGWTTDTLRMAMLRELDDLRGRLDERLLAQKEAVGAALEASEKAVTKAEVSTDKRFEAANKIKEAMADQASQFMPRAESTARWQAVTEKLDTHTTQADARFGAIETRMAAMAGADRGSGDHFQKMLGTIGAVSGVMAIIGVLITLFTVLSR